MPEGGNRLQRVVDLSKDVLALLREIGLVVFFVLLLAFPEQLSRVLRRAGFTSGEIGPWHWENSLNASQQGSKDAGQHIAELNQQLQDLGLSIDTVKQRVRDPSVKRDVDSLSSQLQETQAQARSADQSLKRSLVAQEDVFAQLAPQKRETTGWIYLGHMDEAKQNWTSGSPKNIKPLSPAELRRGQKLTLRDDAYLRGDPVGRARATAAVLSVLQEGQELEVLDVDYSHARAGGWFVWVKVSRI